jgi:hypothetical protein
VTHAIVEGVKALIYSEEGVREEFVEVTPEKGFEDKQFIGQAK